MKDDFDIIVKGFSDNKDLVIYPVSDLHIGAKECLMREWMLFKNRLLEESDSYLVILGDMMNNALKSSVSNSYEETMRPREQKQWLVEQLSEVRNKILCIVPGNHCARSEKDADDNPLYDVACKLDLEDVYRENMAIVKIRIGKVNGNGAKNPTYTMVCVHGSGGGALTGGAINRNERYGMAFDGVDILCTGHTHKPVVTRPAKIVVDTHNNRVTVKPFITVTATSWLGYSGYAARKMLTPTSHALQQIHLCGSCKEVTVTI